MLELPMKELLRVDEAAAYFSVTERTIRLWVENGHLEAVKIVGSIRITRESALKCRFGVKKDAENSKIAINIDGQAASSASLIAMSEKEIDVELSKPEKINTAKRGRPPAVQCQT